MLAGCHQSPLIAIEVTVITVISKRKKSDMCKTNIKKETEKNIVCVDYPELLRSSKCGIS